MPDDETDDVEMREGLGRVGSEKVVLMVVVVVLEEEPLRSDTRLPQESSPYMAGNFLHVNLAAGQVDFLQRNRQRSLSSSSSSSQFWTSIWTSGQSPPLRATHFPCSRYSLLT